MKQQVKKAICLVGLLMAVVFGYLGQQEAPAGGSSAVAAGPPVHPVMMNEIGWP